MSRRSPIIQDESNTDPELEPLAPSDPSCPEKPALFDYLTENIYYTETLTSRERKKAKRMVCECQFDPEQDDPEDACGETCLNRLLMIECGSRCPCGEYCTNKRFQRGVYSPVEVFRTQKKGWGLRTLINVPQGTFVMEYCGEVITPDQFEERKKQYTNEKRRHYYFMSLRSDEILDATQKGNYSRFINHSCDPNCETQKWTVQGKLRIGFFSVREILEGEEVTFDYQFQRFGDVAQRCYCGSSNCRGYLGQSKQATPLRVATTRSLRDIGSPREGGWRRRSAARSENQEDYLFEKQIYDIVGSSWRLRSTDHVISISRIMLQAESLSQRVMLLHVLQATEDQACLRKFLSLHGLRLLWSWMADSPEPDSVNVLHFREQLLQTLGHLPITTRNQVADSHLVIMVTRWLKPTTKPQDQVSGITCPPQPSPVLSQPQQQQQRQVEESNMEATVVTEADSNMDIEASRMEEEEGSCDSVSLITPRSCDYMPDSNKSHDLEQDFRDNAEAMEPDLNLRQTVEGGKNALVQEEKSNNEAVMSSAIDAGSFGNGLSPSEPPVASDPMSGSCDLSNEKQHKAMSCDSAAQTCAPEFYTGSAIESQSYQQVALLDLSTTVENQSCDMKVESCDNEMEMQAKELGSDDKELASHNMEVASYDKDGEPYNSARGKEFALHASQVPSHDREVESYDKELASHAMEVPSCDKEVESHDSELEPHDRELASHDMEVPSHDKEVESHDSELEPHDKGLASYDMDVPSHDKDVESHDKELASHMDVTSHAKEVESYDKELGTHDMVVPSHVKEVESHDKELASHDIEMVSHDREVESQDSEWEPHGIETESHDREVESRDSEQEPHNMEIESHDNKWKQHDKEVDKLVKSQDSKLGPHSNEWEADDVEMESHDKEVKSQDIEQESRGNKLAAHDMEPSDVKVESQGSEQEPHDMEMASCKNEGELHVHELKSHDKVVESLDKPLESHDGQLEPHSKELAAHGMEMELHDKKVESQDRECEPHDVETVSHETEGGSQHDKQVTSYDKEMESLDMQLKSHDSELDPHGNESASPDMEVASLDKQVELHDNQVEPHSKDLVAHDTEVASHDQQVESNCNQLEPHGNELAAHDMEEVSHDKQVELHDDQLEPNGNEMAAHDKEVESHDKQVESHDKQVESLDEQQLHGKVLVSEGTEIASHDKELMLDVEDLESCDKEVMLQDKELGSSHDAEISHERSSDMEMTSPNVEIESHENSLVILRDSGPESHDTLMNAGMRSPETGVVSAESETQLRDDQVMHNETGKSDILEIKYSCEAPVCVSEAVRVDEVKEKEENPLHMMQSPAYSEIKCKSESCVVDTGLLGEGSNCDVQVHVTSTEVEPSEILHEESHAVKSRDNEAKSNDVEVKTLNPEVKLHESDDNESKSHEIEVKSHDHEAEYEVESHDTETKLQARSHKAKVKSLDTEVKLHDSEDRSNVSEAKLQGSEVGLHDGEVKLHDSEGTSHDREAESLENKVESHDTETMSHDSEVKSHDCETELLKNEVESHDTETKSHDVKSHDHKQVSLENEVESHDIETESQDSEVKSQDSDIKLQKSYDSEATCKFCSNEAESLESKVKSHDTATTSHDNEAKSHDKMYYNDVSSDSQSGEEMDLTSCEAEAKQVGGVADEALLAASTRVVTMATELLEKWEGLKEVFRIPKRARTAKKLQQGHSPLSAHDGVREEEGRDAEGGGRGWTPKGGGSGGRRGERKRRWDHWNRSPPPPDPPALRQPQDATPSWSGKRKVLLPKPKKVFSSSTSPITPSHHHASSQGIPITTSTVASSATAAPPVQSPYVITQNTGASFTSSTHFPAPPIPVQNTVIVQQGGQSVYVQQQVYRDGCQTTIMPTHYMPPTQPFMIPPPSVQLQPTQSTTLQPPPFPSTVTSHTLTQAPPTISPQAPLTQPLPTHPHLPVLPALPSLPPQIPPTGFLRPAFPQPLPQMMVAPPTSQSTVPPSSLPLPPPPTETGLPHNWRTAKDPQGKTYYYHVITRKSQWTRPTDWDADGSVTMDLASSDEVKEDSSQTESLRAPRTPDGTPPPLTMVSEKNYDTESTDATPSPCPSPHYPIHTSTVLPTSHSHQYTHSPQRSPLPSPHTPPLLPPPSTPPSCMADHHTHQLTPHKSPSPPYTLPLPGPSTPPRSPSHSPIFPIPQSPITHSPPEPHAPPEKRAKVMKDRHHKQKETFKHKLSKVVTQCLDQHRKPDCKYGRITCSEDFKYLARKLTHGLAEKELQRRHGSTGDLVFNDSIRSKVKEYIRQYMKKCGPIYTRV